MRPNDNFANLFKEAKEFYQKVGSIYCPALKMEVYFTAEGFHHLRYNKSGRERRKSERRNKLSSMPAATETIRLSATIQEYRIILEPVGLKNVKGFRVMTKVHYFGFWAVLDYKRNPTRVKAIVRQIDGGQFNFWSVMPYWKRLNGRKVFGSIKLRDE